MSLASCTTNLTEEKGEHLLDILKSEQHLLMTYLQDMKV